MVKTIKPSIYLPTRFIAVLALVLPPTIQANIGVNWLINQTHTGGISTPNDVATNYQSTSESLRAFHALGENQPFVSQVVQILNANHDLSTENLCQQIIVNVENGNDSSSLVNELMALQNADGGFGEVKGFDSTVLNTAFALQALAIAGIKETPAIEHAIHFLIEHQNPNNGSFGLNVANESAIYVTAKASQALQRFLFHANVTTNIEAANNYLYQNQVEEGGWATDWETAHALLAVASATAETSLYTSAAQALRSHQATNGSWGEDAYTTALALRALHYVKRIQFPLEPDKGILTGRAGLSLYEASPANTFSR